MAARGGHARNVAQRQAQRRARGQWSGTAGASNTRRGARQVRQGDMNVTSASHLRQRAHRPGEAAGSYDPRRAASGQLWGKGVHDVARQLSTTQYGINRAKQGTRYGNQRWWEDGDLSIAPSTDITYAQDMRTERSRETGWSPESWYESMEARWGEGGAQDPFTIQGMDIWNTPGAQEGGWTGAGGLF